MQQTYPSLTKALTIEERINAFNVESKYIFDDIQLIYDWLNIRSLVNEESFNESLKIRNIKKENFAFALKNFTEYENSILYNYLEQQNWFQLFNMIFDTCNVNLNNIDKDQLVIPFSEYIKQEIFTQVKELKNISVSAKTIEEYIADCKSILSRMTWKCLIIELHQFKQHNELKGNDGHERYLDFIKRKYSSIDKIKSFYLKYPVLLRLLINRSQDFINSTMEMFKFIDGDYHKISNHFGLSDNKIIGFETSKGDTHQRGRSVSKLIFSNSKELIYKPRNLYIQKAFSSLINYFNENSGLMDLRTNNVYYAEKFTVEEVITHKECTNKNQLNNYYYRIGELIVLLGIVGATDMHSENIIASGEYPYIIDCETLLSQYEYDLEDNANLEVINDHILRLFAIGILPTKGFDNNVEGKGVDVSGLGGGQEEIYPTKVLVPINVYTDEMRFEYKYDAVIKANENLPKFKNKTITYHNYKNDIIQGFDDALNFVYRNRKEIIELIENTFQNLLVRQLTKSTAVYGDLLTFADHPHYLSDSKHLEKLFENNWANPYKDKRIVPYEVNDMLNMDIPIFFCNTSKNHIITSNYEYIEDYFPKSGLEITISRLKKLNMKEVNKEKLKLRILLGNYYELIDERDKKMPEISYQEDYLNKEKIFDTCNKIAYKIMDLCYYSKSGKYVSWPYIDTTDGFYKITSIENGLYSGRAGILLFLNYLSKYTTDRNIIEFTEKVKNTTKDYGIYHHHGVFSGSLGEAYVLLKCNIDDPTYFKKLYSRYSKNSKYSKNNTYTGIDWLGGGASLVKLLDNNQNILTSKSLLYEEIAKIITTIKSNLDMFLEKESSIGMGHGGIGILYAMLIAQNKYGINCEKDIEKILDHTLNQIKDLNYYKNDYIHSKNHTSWCHGTTGLGIGAVACLKYLNDDRLVHFKELALRQAINDSNQNMSLCHGLSGNLDFLITCSLLSPQDRFTDYINSTSSQIANYFLEHGQARLQELDDFRDVGLFMGLSGVGYSLLRSIFPEEIPSVLTLD